MEEKKKRKVTFSQETNDDSSTKKTKNFPPATTATTTTGSVDGESRLHRGKYALDSDEEDEEEIEEQKRLNEEEMDGEGRLKRDLVDGERVTRRSSFSRDRPGASDDRLRRRCENHSVQHRRRVGRGTLRRIGMFPMEEEKCNDPHPPPSLPLLVDVFVFVFV